ncbi:MAG: orotate phosphoribosyltransferase [Methanomicrobiales archaeon]
MSRAHQDNGKKDLIELLKKNEVIKFGNFRLSSGKSSNYYVDMKKAITDPEILSKIAEIICNQIDVDKIDKIAGPALGAVPIATAVSLKSKIPLLMIRKAQKGYGTSKLIEGDLKKNDSVVVVEDVTTTGNSLLKAVEAIRANGGIVETTYVVVDRNEGAFENLQESSIDFKYLISVKDLN